MTFIHKHTEPICISLTSEAYAAAEVAYEKQVPSRRQQTYLNVLAIHAVQQYLQWLAIPTDWGECDSNDPTLRRFLDVADLEVKGCGRLECRPVLPGVETLNIPSEVQSDRIGYIAVQFDEALETATLLGFTKIAHPAPLPLAALNPVEMLLDVVGTAPAALSPVEALPEALLNWQEPIQLGDWFNNQFNHLVAKGWQALEKVEAFIAPESRLELAFSVRGAATAVPVKRGKLVDFEKGTNQVALVVGLQESNAPETEILVEVYPTGEQVYLPQDLELMVLDDMGIAVMQAQARSNKKIQMEFSGESGEEFSIKLVLGDFSVTEAFQL